MKNSKRKLYITELNGLCRMKESFDLRWSSLNIVKEVKRSKTVEESVRYVDLRASDDDLGDRIKPTRDSTPTKPNAHYFMPVSRM